MVKKGSWVQVHAVVLRPDERAPQVPDSTKEVPLEMWVKGILQAEGEIGSQVEIRTVTGRLERGELVQVEPTYTHSFGNYVPEILEIDRILQSELFGGEGA